MIIEIKPLVGKVLGLVAQEGVQSCFLVCFDSQLILHLLVNLPTNFHVFRASLTQFPNKQKI